MRQDTESGTGSFLPIEEVGVFSSEETDSVDRPVMDRLKELTPGSSTTDKLTVPSLEEGEQFRFHFDMTRCIGCRCCEVACNEQNNNPPEVTWRRVGEIEGGSYPNVTRLNLSMACNHCLEPSCLEGCPVDAYTKLDNGIVDHDAESCIGCQYCMWNCPYGVPQYHPERRVVTKCHLCVDRLSEGQLPACVNACPTQAIEIEAVNVEEWRKKVSLADAPGVPSADLTLSTTRITTPDNLPASFGDSDVRLLQREAAHWSLVAFLTLSQWSVGMFAVAPFVNTSVAVSLAVSTAAWIIGVIALNAALFHLGRPLFAIRAMKAWRHSWLSREVIAFSVFAAVGALPPAIALARFLGFEEAWASPFAFSLTCALTALSGVIGIVCSIGIYRIPARPAWDSRRTGIQFFATAVLLGAGTGLFVALGTGGRESLIWVLTAVAGLAAIVQAYCPWQLVLEGITTADSPLRGTATLLSGEFGRLLWSRTFLLLATALLLPIAAIVASRETSLTLLSIAVACSFVAEIIARYLFFVTVVPRNMPGSFFGSGGAH